MVRSTWSSAPGGELVNDTLVEVGERRRLQGPESDPLATGFLQVLRGQPVAVVSVEDADRTHASSCGSALEESHPFLDAGESRRLLPFFPTAAGPRALLDRAR